MTTNRPHPHFDDRGTLDWNTRWVDALAQAKREGKRVFVELGREACGSCRSLVQAVVPRPDVSTLLQQHFVALAADADETEPEVEGLALNLEDAMMLPFVLFTDADGRFLEGSSGAQNPANFAAALKRVSGAA